MPDLTPDQIATNAASPLSASVDGQAAEQVPIPDQLQALDRKSAANAVSGTNRCGGPRSVWNFLHPARAITEGAG